MTLQNDRFIRALRRQPVDRTPLWIMRQAGRYLPEYRETRQLAGDFVTLCKTPELACTVTLQPLQRFDLDAAIIFSDILTIPDAMGLGLSIIEKQGPKFEKPIRTLQDIASLPAIDPNDELAYVMQAIRLVKQELANKIPLIGFSGSPFTLATYMIEGGSSRDFIKTKTLMYQHPAEFKQLIQHLSQQIQSYCAAQIEAGVDAIMIFDTWGSILPPPQYREYSQQAMSRIVRALPGDIPSICYIKSSANMAKQYVNSGCAGLGVDWTVDLGALRQEVGDSLALQGNLDPGVLYTNEQTIEHHVSALLQSYGPYPGHVFNLGHGILPTVDPERVSLLVEAVKRISQQIHASHQ